VVRILVSPTIVVRVVITDDGIMNLFPEFSYII
jgi:hypothetical protein